MCPSSMNARRAYHLIILLWVVFGFLQKIYIISLTVVIVTRYVICKILIESSEVIY